MSTWLLPSIELTPDQLRIVEMPSNAHKIVIGPPGSGKTQILVHRAAYLSEKYNLSAEEYRVFVFTNVVKEYIKSGIQFLGLPENVVSTFDHWCRLIYEKHISHHLPRNGYGIDFEEIRLSVLDLLQSKKELQKKLSFVLVDEGQDLVPETYDILTLATRHITVFMDPQQNIFEKGASESFVLNKLGLNSRSAYILQAYRNSPYVAKLASYFIEDSKQRQRYLSQVSTQQKIKELPMCYVASDFKKEMDKLAEMITQRQIMNEKIGIIVPTNKQLHGFTRGLEERGIFVEKAVAGSQKSSQCDFNNNAPKIATYFSAKGLTFDSVLLPRLTESSFSWIRNNAIRKRLLFVGIARATQWAYLSTVTNKESSEFDILEKAERNGDVVIQYKDTIASTSYQQESEDDEFSVL